MTNTTDHLIISSPYEKPKVHLKYIRELRKFEILEGAIRYRNQFDNFLNNGQF